MVLQTARPQGVTLSNLVGRMERIKFKKEMLLEMRTDGEITKQELQELQAEYDSKAHNSIIGMEQPEWGKIQAALEEILDLSQPTPNPDLIHKFVAQIVPEGTCSPLAFGAVIEYPTLSRAARDKNA